MTTTQARTDDDTIPDVHRPEPPSTLEEELRTALAGLARAGDAVLDLLIVDQHRSAAPEIYDVPVSTELAHQLLEQVVETADAAAAAELRHLEAGFTPGPQQWLHGAIPDGPLADLESLVLRRTHRQYDRDAEFGSRNLLVLRVRSLDGAELGRVYQGFSTEKALAKGKRIVAFWNGERFASLEAQPLVIDRTLRLFTFGESGATPAPAMVMKSNHAYESLFGALPDLRVQAAETFTATLGKLPIVGGEELRAACESDLNMMRKLLSIKHRMEQPGYPDAVDMPSVVAFLERNPHVNVPVETSGGSPALVFRPQVQQRWALLKLLDDDFLRSDLTNINYEANSKTEVSRRRTPVLSTHRDECTMAARGIGARTGDRPARTPTAVHRQKESGMTEAQPAAESNEPEQDHPDQPHHMTETDSDARPTTPEVPPVPGADANADELAGGADRQPGAPAKQQDSDDAQQDRQPKDEVTSPRLEHLDETIEKAKHAADEALAPQRE